MRTLLTFVFLVSLAPLAHAAPSSESAVRQVFKRKEFWWKENWVLDLPAVEWGNAESAEDVDPPGGPVERPAPLQKPPASLKPPINFARGLSPRHAPYPSPAQRRRKEQRPDSVSLPGTPSSRTDPLDSGQSSEPSSTPRPQFESTSEHQAQPAPNNGATASPFPAKKQPAATPSPSPKGSATPTLSPIPSKNSSPVSVPTASPTPVSAPDENATPSPSPYVPTVTPLDDLNWMESLARKWNLLMGRAPRPGHRLNEFLRFMVDMALLILAFAAVRQGLPLIKSLLRWRRELKAPEPASTKVAEDLTEANPRSSMTEKMEVESQVQPLKAEILSVWETLWRAAEQAADPAIATRTAFLAVLAYLEDKDHIRYSPGSTNRDYAKMLSVHREEFQCLARAFDRVRYGSGEPDFEQFRPLCQSLLPDAKS